MKRYIVYVLLLVLFSCNNQHSGNEKITSNTKSNTKITIQKLVRNDPKQVLICQNWILKDATPPKEKDLEDFGSRKHGIPSLYILSDHTIIENPLSKNIRLGDYDLESNIMKVKFHDGGKLDYIVDAVSNKTLHLTRIENGNRTELKFSGPGFTYPDAKDNPFHPVYNSWRIKPAHPEDTAALKNRLRNFISFYLQYFTDVVNNDADAIDFHGLPCCLNWYSGGISIQLEKNIDPAWLECFYSKQQALEARDILEKAVFRKHKWDTGITKWVEQDIPVLKSIRDSI